MNFSIRAAAQQDFAAVLSLIRELAEFEKAKDKVTNSVSQMEKEKDFFNCFVAEKPDGEIIGFALYFFAYYTWTGKALYLDDIYVKKEFRGLKVGSALLNEVFRIARNEECKRVRWQVLNWNKPAIELYKKCGALVDDEWLNCDFDAAGISKFRL